MTHDMRRLLRQRTTAACRDWRRSMCSRTTSAMSVRDLPGEGDARREGVAMTICSGRSFTVCLLAGVLASISPAYAGPTDTPLPTFSDGKSAVAVYTAVGVI